MTLVGTRAHVRAALSIVLCVLGAFTLVACQTADNVPPKQIEMAPEPVEPAPVPAPAPITIPECNAINTAAEAEQSAFIEAYGADRITAPYGDTDRSLFDEFASPAAQTAAAAATQERSCNWVVYLDSVYLYQFTAELPEAAREPLLADLRSTDFFESTRGPATVFSAAFVTGDMRGTVGITHLFVGDVWIVLVENAALNYEQGAIDAILAANPALAEQTMTTCVDQTAADAISRSAGEVRPRAGLNGPGVIGGWDVDLATQLADDTFDACAPLSWVLLPAAAGPDSGSTHGAVAEVAVDHRQTITMFFHYGKFVGTDSVQGASLRPAVTRVSRKELRAEYRVPEHQQGNASTARPVATFTWDSSSDTVLRGGDEPQAHEAG